MEKQEIFKNKKDLMKKKLKKLVKEKSKAKKYLKIKK